MLNDMDRGFWAINFDLDTKEAEKLHPSHTHQGAYTELKRFFTSSGFAHRQHSGYVSKGELTTDYMRFLAFTLNRLYPYAKHYIKNMDATIVKPDYIFDFKEYFNDEATEETVEYTGEVENFIPQPKLQETKEFDQMQNEEVIPKDLKSEVLKRRVANSYNIAVESK